jgi:hypothetical protein
VSHNKIFFEISEIDKLLDDVGPLLLLCKQRNPDLIETMASAAVLHSFYNGLENIFFHIAKDYDKSIPVGNKWHKKLLDQMLSGINRKPVLSGEIYQKLNEYLIFRHFFRHAYSYKLDWDEMKELVLNIESVWIQVKAEITDFLKA